MESIHTVKGGREIVHAAIQNTLANPEQGADYLARPAGSSLVGVDCSNGWLIAEFLRSLDWHCVTYTAKEYGVRFGACEYFWASLPEEVQGLEGIALLSELSDEELKGVRVVKGHHGNLELQLEGLEARPTREVHIIVGNLGNFPAGEVTLESAGVVTWYPGRLTRPAYLDQEVVKRA
ncbi:MAG: hypothetical protein EB165_04390 [Euryarchaeota archaeon]|nr:hypothetical protein [Euryarchaeota archaeon]